MVDCIDMVKGYIQPFFFIQQAEKKKEIKERHSLFPFNSHFLLFVSVNPPFRAPSWQVRFSPPKHSFFFFESSAKDKIGRDTILD